MENMRSIQYANVSQRRSRIDGFRTGLGYRTHQWDRFLRGKIVCRCGFLVICVLCFGGRDGHSAHAGDLHLAGVVHSGIGGVAGDRPGDSAPPAATIGTQGKFLPVDDRGAWLAGDGKSRLLRLANGKALRFCAGIVACTGDSYVGGGAGIQCVQQLGVAEKHRRLILLGGDGIIDVAKTHRFRILAAKLKDPIRPEAADGNDVLYGSRYREPFFVLLECGLQSFNQVLAPPSSMCVPSVLHIYFPI